MIGTGTKFGGHFLGGSRSQKYGRHEIHAVVSELLRTTGCSAVDQEVGAGFQV